MSLTAKDVADITRLLEESSFDELYLELDGLKLRVRRRGAGHQQAQSAAAGSQVPEMPHEREAAAVGAAVASAPPVSGVRPASRGTMDAGDASCAPAHSAQAAKTASASAPPSPASDPNVQDVPSPLLGTFYRAPKPGAAPFVEVGSPVDEDTIIGIIEVMKLMNTVRAGVRGSVTEILGRDGVLVESGETLMRVRRSASG